MSHQKPKREFSPVWPNTGFQISPTVTEKLPKRSQKVRDTIKKLPKAPLETTQECQVRSHSTVPNQGKHLDIRVWSIQFLQSQVFLYT